MTKQADQVRNLVIPIIVAGAVAALAFSADVRAAGTDLAPHPFVTETEGLVTVKPNLYFILDDSGSMTWDYLPDWTPSSYCKNNAGTTGGSCSNTRPLMRSPDYNAVYYNPAISYLPPKNPDGTEKTSYDGVSAVPYDAFSGGSSLNLTTNYADEEWCVGSSTTDCLRADNYLVPGTLNGKNYTTVRSTTANGTKSFVSGTSGAPVTTDRAMGPYYYVMIPGEYCADPKLVNCQAMPGPGFQGSTYYGYPAKVRWCTGAGACQGLRVGSYSSIRYPTLNVGGGTIVPGSFRRTDIVTGRSYGNTCVSATGTVTEVMGVCPAGQTTIVDRSGRIDCAGKPTCTYAEELRNFANWHAWYRTRMQMAKTSLSRAFSTIGDTFRVGYFTINGQRLVNPAPFDAAQKSTWYSTMLGTPAPYGTPNRLGLAYAGRLYAGKKTAVFSGASDPVEYSCQRNFAILATDGYWNGSAGQKIDGSAIGNEDSTGMEIGGVTGPFSDGWSNTFADVAAYYYKTDLRSPALNNCTGALGAGINVCTDNVPTSTLPILRDSNTQQHMATFTIGLGIDGVMKYREDYQTPSSEPTDDFDAVRNGRTANPAAGVCPWQSSGACGWPNPSGGGQETIDDLWHAAVNGHGKYFSASDSQALTNGLQEILTAIGAKTGASAGATTSSPNAVAGNNYIFSSTFKTVDWVSTFMRETINEATGVVGFDSGKDWYANTLLDSASWSSRNIYTFKSGGGTPRDFDWTALSSSGSICNPPANELACFTDAHISANLSQWPALTPANKTAAAGVNLVNFLRGDKANEDTATETKLYRQRKSRLGDIVGSEAFYVGSYMYEYGNGYPAKGTTRADPTVYVAANDGMLHAFNAGDVGSGGGTERWAYVPSMAVKEMHRLASKDYHHRYFVDGSPTAVDVYTGGNWKTILVGGLGGGGPGFYALDITDQTSPKVLWEFRQKADCNATTPSGSARYDNSGIPRMIEDCDLGYSFGNPIITKLPGGQWVVLLTSGYNNHVRDDGKGGDGKGYLYVLDAMTGSIQYKVSTGVGSASDPSGFAKIATWADNYNTDNLTKYVYGGDLKGNMWKFDLTSGAPNISLLYSAGSSKPITAKPRLGLITTKTGVKKRVVFFPTGKLLGLSDLEPTGTYSFYAIWDAAGVTPVPSTIISSSASGSDNRTGNIYDPNNDGKPDSVFDENANLGWKLDFPAPGERGTTDPNLAGSTLLFTTNQPQSGSSDPCNKSAFQGWLWNIDYKSGHAIHVAGETGGNRPMAEALGGYGTRPVVVILQSGKPVSITTVTKGSGVERRVSPIRIEDNPEGAKRVAWRELTQ